MRLDLLRGMGLIVLLALLTALPWIAPFFYLFIATQILILGLFAASFNLIFGYTGMLSFGHAAFFGTGAYATAMLLQSLQWPLLACLLISFLAGTVLALIIGYFCVRLDEVYFAMLTLAFGMMVYAIVHQWRSVTNGSDGISGFSVRSLGLGLNLSLGDPSVYYHVVLAITVVAALVLYRICGSSFGLILRAIRQNPERVTFCGVNIRLYRLAAFTIGGGFAGLAGGLMAPFLQIASPDLAHWTMSAEPILMTILGGSGYFLGPFLGSVIFVLLETWITSLTEAWMLYLGIILALMVMFFRRGVLGTLLSSVSRWGGEEFLLLLPETPVEGVARQGSLQILRRRAGSGECRSGRAHGGNPGDHRSQRRGQDDVLQPAFRAHGAFERGHRIRGPGHHGRAGASHQQTWDFALVPDQQHLSRDERTRKR